MLKIQRKILVSVLAFSITTFSFLALSSNSTVSAASLDFSTFDRAGKAAFNGGIGFTLSPDTFIVAPGIDFYLSNGFSIGPDVQFGFNDNILLFTGMGMFKYMFDFNTQNFMRRFKPVIEGGGGIALVNIDPAKPGDSKFEAGAIVTFGLGFDIFLTNSISLGNHMYYNFLTPNLSDRFMFSWQFVVFKYFF